jgi:hypothetical protein
MANPPPGVCPPPPPPPLDNDDLVDNRGRTPSSSGDNDRPFGDYRAAEYLQAAADLEKKAHSALAAATVARSAVAAAGEGLSRGEGSDLTPQELLQNALDNPSGSLYQNSSVDEDLYTSLPHLPIERPTRDASDGGKEGDIEAQQGEGAGEDTTTGHIKGRRRSSIIVRKEVNKWKSLETWRQWSISMWSEFLGTFLLVFIGM